MATWTHDDLAGPASLPPYATEDSRPAVDCVGNLQCVAIGQVVAHRSSGVARTWVEVPLPIHRVRDQRRQLPDLRRLRRRRVGGRWPGRGVPRSGRCVGGRRDAVGRGVADRDRLCRGEYLRRPAIYPDEFGGTRGRFLWWTHDSGLTWSAGDVLTGTYEFGGDVSCGSRTSCLALGDGSSSEEVLRTRNGGGTWQPVQPPDVRFPQLLSVSCASATSCFVLFRLVFGDDPIGWRTTNLGSTWQSSGLDEDLAPVDRVECWSTTCLGAGRSLARSTDSGLTWSALPVPRRAMELEGLACTPTGRCVAVAVDSRAKRAPVVTTDAGTTWRRDTTPVDATSLIDCYSQVCLFVSGRAVYADRS